MNIPRRGKLSEEEEAPAISRVSTKRKGKSFKAVKALEKTSDSYREMKQNATSKNPERALWEV